MLFAWGIENFRGFPEFHWAAIMGWSWAMFVPGELASCLVAVMVAHAVLLRVNVGASAYEGRRKYGTELLTRLRISACAQESGCECGEAE
jgi:hypothetical protein